MTVPVGVKIKMEGERQRYTVRASDDRYVILAKPFNARKTYLYCIVDLERGVRGPCDLIFGPIVTFDTPEGAQENLRMLQSGEQGISRRRDKALEPSELLQIAAFNGATNQ